MDAGDLLQISRENWPKPLGLILSWCAALAFATMLVPLLGVKAASFGLVGTAVLLLVSWERSRKLRRCPKEFFGVVLAISVEDSSTLRIFERDFIWKLQEVLSSGALADRVWIYAVPQIFLERAPTEQDALTIQKRTNASLLLWGQVRTRNEDQVRHYLDMRGLVQHAKTSVENTQLLTREFTELLPGRLIATKNEELPAFEMSSVISSLVAKYIGGIASFLSNNFEYASALYSDANQIAESLAKKQPIAQKIFDRIPMRFAEIALARATRAYQKWRESRTDEDLDSMIDFLQLAPAVAHEVPQWKALTAISLVAKANDKLDGIEDLVKGGPSTDPVTHVNLAFFDLVRGDFRSATRRYRKAEELSIPLTSVEEVMSFLEWYADFRRPRQAEMSFGLAYISYCMLGDVLLASNYFRKFNDARGHNFAREAQLMENWIADLEKRSTLPASLPERVWVPVT